MRIDVLTLFPAMLDGFLSESMMGRAQEAKLLDIKVHNLRDWAKDKHSTTDDRPFGGGPGMVMLIDPLRAVLQAARAADPAPEHAKHRNVTMIPADGARVVVVRRD